MAGGRLIYDISSVARWTGAPVGIIRTQRELAIWARRERPDVKLLDSLGTLFEPGFGIPAVAACLHGARIFSATELSAQAGCPALPLHQEHCDACDQNHDEGDDQRYFRGA